MPTKNITLMVCGRCGRETAVAGVVNQAKERRRLYAVIDPATDAEKLATEKLVDVEDACNECTETFRALVSRYTQSYQADKPKRPRKRRMASGAAMDTVPASAAAASSER